MQGEWATSVVETRDGRYAWAGSSDSIGPGGLNFLLLKTDVWKYGLVWTDSKADTITVYRGLNDVDWNYVRVRVWKPKE